MRASVVLYTILLALSCACFEAEPAEPSDDDDDDEDGGYPDDDDDDDEPTRDAALRDAAPYVHVGDAGLGSDSAASTSCSSDQVCPNGQYCQEATCRPRGAEGASCTRDFACGGSLICQSGKCAACPDGQARMCQTDDLCTCGPLCGDASPTCATGTSCGRYTADPTRGICALDSWWTVRCGGCGEGEFCNDKAKCEPYPLPSAGILKLQVLRNEQAELEYVYDIALDLVAFDEEGHSSGEAKLELRDVEDEDFLAHWGGEIACTVTVVQSDARSVSVPLVLDQSGSITGTDPSDVRIPAAKAFLSSLSSMDQSALLSFAQGNSCSSFDVTMYGTGFGSDHTSFFGTLDMLASCEGGGTPLYDAVNAGVNLVQTQGAREAKAVLVFTDGDDTASKTTESQVIQEARANAIKLFTIGLSNGVNHQVLARIAQSTGGAYFQANQVGSAISAFRGMNQLLTGTYHRYECSNSLTVTVPADQTPGWMTTSIGVDVGGKRVWAPVRLDF